MKACIVFAHEGDHSFNHEILARVKKSCEAANIQYVIRDLYEMNFQPVFTALDMKRIEHRNPSSDIEEEQSLITESDILIMIYPVWWWSPPAILKGYLDRVFTNGFAFRYEEDGPVGILRNKRAFVFTTTRESAKEMAEKGLDLVVRKQIVEGTLEMIGYEVEYQNFAAVTSVEEEGRELMLRLVEQKINSIRQPIPL